MLPAALRSAVVVLALASGALLAAGTFGLGVESARLYGAASAWLAVPWVIAALVLATVIRPRLASVARLIPR